MALRINLLRHAKTRIRERGLNEEEVTAKCLKAAPLMTDSTAMRVRVGKTTIVARRQNDSQINIITAWPSQSL
jgi:hypothetical protein